MVSKNKVSSLHSLNPLAKFLVWFLAILASYTMFGFWGVPKIVRYVLVKKAPESLHRNVRVQDVSFNPFKLDLKIKGIEIGSRIKGKEFLRLKRIDLNLEVLSLLKRALIISSLKVESPSFFLERDKNGNFTIDDLIGSGNENNGEGNKGSKPIRFSINNIEIKNGRIVFDDRFKDSVHRIEKIDIGIPFISDLDQKVRIYVKPYFSAVVNGSPIAFQGRTRPFANDRDTIIDLKFTNIDIPHYLAYMPDIMGLRLGSGCLDTNLSIHFTEKKNPTIILSGNAILKDAAIEKKNTRLITIEALELNLKPSRLFSRKMAFKTILSGVALRDVSDGSKKLSFNQKSSGSKNIKKAGDTGFLSIPRTDVTGVDIDLLKGKIDVNSVNIHGPVLRFLMQKDGTSNLERFYSFLVSGSSSAKKKDEGTSEDGKSKKEEGKEMLFHIGAFKIEKAHVEFTDNSVPEPVRLHFSGLETELRDISTKKGRKFNFTAKTQVNKTGLIKISGTGMLSTLGLQTKIMASNVPLPPLQGYVSPHLNMELGRGHVSLKAMASFQKKGNRKILSARGTTKIQNVLLFGKKSQEPLTKWREIAINNFSIGYEPLKVDIKEIVLNRVKQNIIVFKDGDSNIASILKAKKDEKASQKTSKRGKTPEGNRQSDKSVQRPVIKIGRVRFKSCKVRMVDRSLKLVFVREFDDIKGTVSGLENRPGMKAKVDISALVDNRSKASVIGLVNPLAKPFFADLTVKIGGAGMTRFSPYAQRFLGYQIERGKMFLDLHIRLNGNKLYVDNRLVLDRFDLGSHVQSKDAINAPIKLAIALLKDRSGKIDLNIPVRGELDDPEFSYRSAVLRAIMNIFIKAATAPFSLLGSVFGSDEKLDSVVFEPGVSKLDDKARKKLDILAKALRDRPALKVEVTGYFDPEADKEGLLERRFMHLLKKEKFEDLPNAEREKIEDIDDMKIDDGEYEKYLEKAYKNASFKRPRNFIGMIKSQPKDVMEKMLKEHISITRGDLKILASERAKAVANYLIRQGKMEQERIFLVAPEGQPIHGKAGFSGVRLSLK